MPGTRQCNLFQASARVMNESQLWHPASEIVTSLSEYHPTTKPDGMELLVNNKTYTTKSDPDEMLLYVLRDELDLTGTKYGCGEGACGACKVLIDGVASPSCLLRIGSLAGKKITTIEGLAPNNELNAFQQACLEVDVFQCGYCASGMIISATALLEKNANPSTDDIVRGMQGNICRCGTYPRLVKAIGLAAKRKS